MGISLSLAGVWVLGLAFWLWVRRVRIQKLRVNFAYRSSAGSLALSRTLSGRSKELVIVNPGRMARRAGMDPSVVGRPASHSASDLLVYARLAASSGEAPYELIVERKGTRRVFPLPALPSAFDVSHSGRYAAIVGFTGTRSYSLGGQLTTGAGVMRFDLESGVPEVVVEPHFDAINDALFLDEDRVVFTGKKVGVSEFSLMLAERVPGQGWNISVLLDSMQGVHMVPGSQNTLWVADRFGRDSKGRFVYGLRRMRVVGNSLIAAGLEVRLGYWWSASLCEDTQELIVALDPKRSKSVTQIVYIDEETGAVRESPELLHLLRSKS